MVGFLIKTKIKTHEGRREKRRERKKRKEEESGKKGEKENLLRYFA